VPQIRRLVTQSDRNRADRFLDRLDAHLASIPDEAARRQFLDRQIDGWEHRYARFVATEGTSEVATDAADPPQAVDFLLTIAGLAARRHAHCNEQREVRMPESSTLVHPRGQKPLGSAVLSLLVAADQRCPAIIGQAHLLYHARLDSRPDQSAKTFAQLKREAADLFQAIADVEAAMGNTEVAMR
jgi:hypothetical protein